MENQTTTELKWFRVTLRHDRGISKMTFLARSRECAIELVKKWEKCPERAILKCERKD